MYVHVMIFLHIFHGFLISMVSVSVLMVSQFCGLGTEVTPCDSTTGFAAFAFERVP